jgi:acetaldehyde dehydrogenase / alcohol dehydrogenase
MTKAISKQTVVEHAAANADGFLRRARAAAAAFRRCDQGQTDRIVHAAYRAALERRITLAKLAHDETGIGVWQHKVVKNAIAAQLVYEDIKHLPTVGVISEDRRAGVIEIAQSLGPVLGLVPVTNPTATSIFKVLIALKTRNPLILCPHPAARQSVAATAEACYEAALAAGAPTHCIQWVSKATPETTRALMSHPDLALILATATGPVVREAQASGTPVFGVGPGNVPVYIGASADLPFAVASIIESKTFDNGTVCASEQAITVKRAIAPRLVAELERQGGYFLSDEEIERVGRIAYDRERGTMTATVVGQSVERIAAAAGIAVPAGTRVLLARLGGVGADYPLSAEILAPILAFFVEDDFDAAIRCCSQITHFGGIGHTAVIYSNDEERIEYFSRTIDASRILVNMPSTHGALGGMFNSLSPSFTLACGSGGNNLTTDNITARHLLNVHRITRRRPNPRWTAFDAGKFLDESLSAEAIEIEYNRNF